MSVMTVEGIVENGRIRLREGVTLPENAKVYVVVPEAEGAAARVAARVRSPRLARPEQAGEFAKQVVVVKAGRDGGV
jgi:hypothetical protein